MNKEIRCPHCNKSLEGRDKFYREVVIDDCDWYGIENGELVYCDITPSQPSYGPLICMNCKEEIEEYINELIDKEELEGEL